MTMTSDILTLNYCVQNELVRNTTKTFIVNMEKVFKHQQKLCRDYIKFLEKIENTESKFVLKRTSDECNENKGSSTNKKPEVIEQNVEHSDSVLNNVSNILPCDTNSHSEQHSNQNKSPTGKSENNISILSSPILPGKRLRTPKTRRHGSSQKCIISVNVSKHNISASIVDNSPVPSDKQVEHAKIPLQVTESKSSSIENKLLTSKCNDNEINDAHTLNNDKTLGINKLYNVDTTFLPNGKKLKQTMLAFHTKEKNISDIFFNENEGSSEQKRNKEMIKPHAQSSSAKENIDTNIIQSTKSPKKKVVTNKMGHNESTHEEIIEVSPVEVNQKSKLKNRIKLKRKASNEPSIKCKKLPRPKQETVINLDCSSSPSSMYTSTQKYQPQVIKRWNTTSGVLHDKSNGNDDRRLFISSPPSPILADLAQAVKRFNELEKEDVQTKSKEVTNDRPQASDSKNVDVTATSEDETYFEERKNTKENDMFTLYNSDFEDDIFLEEAKSVKRTLLDSFDRVPPKRKRNLNNGKNPRTKAERAKLNGWSCWECEKYYGNLGLSEEELQKRMNLCSRHRSEFKRRDTPEGFWDPLFPDTQSSTYQSE